MNKPRVFRIHIRPDGGLGNRPLSFEFCLRNGLLGMGWPIGYTGDALLSWQDYEATAIKQYGPRGISRVRFFRDNVGPDHLIWTRDTNGRYYLARVLSSWEYHETVEGRDADIVNVVRCDIKALPSVDHVPGKVIACFRPSRTIQSIYDAPAVNYSMLLWNRIAGEQLYNVVRPQRVDLFSYLDDGATEDLVFLYLQLQGWLVLPMSRKADTMAYEYVLIHRTTRDRAVVQVKTGWAPIDLTPWAAYKETVFVFQPNRYFQGTAAQNVVIIDPDEILDFAINTRELLPKSVMLWLDELDEAAEPA